jgi:glycopeptide antibiotics resistance protein
MIDVAKRIIENVLIALYQPFGFSIIMAVLAMFFYMLVKEFGLKATLQRWLNEFKTSSRFRRIFVLVFYIALMLFKTLLNRDMWRNPISNVIGIWGLYNEKGELTTEVIENIALFIPFAILLLWSFHEKFLGEGAKLIRTIWQSIKVVFLFSLIIEFLQLLMRLGTFQLSDLFYNTLGGLVGGLIYWIGYKVTHRNRKDA